MVWGTGSFYEKYRTRIEEGCYVLGFIDSDKAKQGSLFHEKEIYAPSELASLNFDMILVFSSYAQEIARELYVMGYTKHQVLFF